MPNNIYQKIQKVRVDLEKLDLKKTGDGGDFSYFQLSDFMPQLNKLLNAQGLMTKFSMDKEKAWLEIQATMNERVKFEIDKTEAVLPGMLAIQSKGATITYLRRYLMIIAFEIVEPDQVDSKKQGEKVLTKEETQKIAGIKTTKELHKHIVALKKKKGVEYQKAILLSFNQRKEEIKDKIIKKQK